MTGPLPREHGTYRGFGQHMRAKDELCPPCEQAGRDYQAEAAERKRREQAERRERWRRADSAPPDGPQADPAADGLTPEQAALLAAHRAGDLILGEAGRG